MAETDGSIAPDLARAMLLRDAAYATDSETAAPISGTLLERGITLKVTGKFSVFVLPIISVMGQ